MDHHCDVWLIVSTDVGEVETNGEVVVHLDRAELPIPTDDVFNYEVNFRTVECSFTVFFGVIDAEGLDRIAECVFRFVPIFR